MRRLAAVALLAGCATTTTSSFNRAGEPSDVATALARYQAPEGVVNATGHPMAFVACTLRTGPLALAFDLSSGTVAWRQPDDLGGRIVVTGPAVAYARKDGTLVARDVRSGVLLWDVRLTGSARRVGYTAADKAVFDVTHDAGSLRKVDVTAYDARTGEILWRTRLEGEAGAPAAGGGLLVLPRRSQYVTLMDAASGRVLADVLSREETASFVRVLPEGIFFGSRGVYKVSPETSTGSRTSGGYLKAKLPEFVRPAYHFDSYRPVEADYSAVDRNRLLWRTGLEGGRTAFTDGLVVVHSFRFFYGMDADTGRLRWAYSHPRSDAVSAERTRSSLMFISSEGEFGALDPRSGVRIWQARIGESGLTVRGATFDAEGFTPPGSSGAVPPLARTLADILWDPDRRFIDAKLYAVAELARVPGREVTAELLRALSSTDLPPQVVDKAVDALVARKDQESIALYEEALRVHTDYAEDRRPPRLEALAKAVTTTKAKQALPALLEHLRLPDTSPQVVRDIADAALATGSRESVDPFRDYLLMYRAEPSMARDPGPLLAASEVIMKLGGAADRALLLFVAQEPRTITPLRTYLDGALFPSGER